MLEPAFSVRGIVKSLAWKQRAWESLRFGALRRSAERLRGPAVLMYHGVVDRLQDPELDRWCLTTGEFVRHLDYLTRHFRVVSLDAVVKGLSGGGPLPEN